MLMLKELPSDVCEEAFPFDPDFPALKIASDPALMLEVFRTHLKPVAGKAFHIAECIPVRFRCRQSGSRCVLQYALRFEERTGESANRRSGETWVTGMLYAEPGRAEQLLAELKAEDLARSIPESLLTFEPLTFIPDLQMLVQVFPFDRRLPSLPRVLSGPWPELQQRLLARFGPGRWQIQAHTVEPLRYRTELGGVVRYTLCARNGTASRSETKRFYAKVYRGQRGEETHQLFRQLCGNTGAARKDFTVVNPVAYCDERSCLVLEEAGGCSLQDVFLNGGASRAAARRVARAVAAFNQSDLHPVHRHTRADQVGVLTRAAALVRWACPAAAPRLDQVVDEVSARLEEVTGAPVHWDLKTDHIFLGAERVTFVDLDTVALADPVRDPAHLLAHIVCRVGFRTVPAETARGAGRAFVEEYFAHVPARWRQRLIVQYAAALVETAGGIFRRQSPQWLERVTAAVEEAHGVLAGGFR